MNAIEIESALSEFSKKPFDAEEFPFDFLAAFGNTQTTIKKLRSTKASSNKSDIAGALLQRDNIHIAVCAKDPTGRTVNTTLKQLKNSPATKKHKAKIILATDGDTIEAEDCTTENYLSCSYTDIADNFVFLLPLAGITPTKALRDSPIDIKATGRLNRLYLELRKNNTDWDTIERRSDMNTFMTRLIFCFFADDTDIFPQKDIFTNTIEKISDPQSNNVDYVISTIFHAMDVKKEDRKNKDLPGWTTIFPYTNGELFSGNRDVPKFNRSARNYLRQAGELDWKEINPDIFGSMVQAITNEKERSNLGMHYTSVPNILKILNPLFIDDLQNSLQAAGTNQRKLTALHKRISTIRVFDPACGSGNFLVVAYKQLRQIEADIHKKTTKPLLKSSILKNNFRGIELQSFPTEIARLALIIAEYQCDVQHIDTNDIGTNDVLADFLPLDAKNWIIAGNALQLDWLSICPPTSKSVSHTSGDMLHTANKEREIDFQNEGGETYICGNPPYIGKRNQTNSQKKDLEIALQGKIQKWKSLDYVAGWFIKAAEYGQNTNCTAAFVSTNSICQGELAEILWSYIFNTGHAITFAYTSFKWANLATHNAGVTVIVVAISKIIPPARRLFTTDNNNTITEKKVSNINNYLKPNENIFITKSSVSLSKLNKMIKGNMPLDDGNLLLTRSELHNLKLSSNNINKFIRRDYGSAEFIRGIVRYCLWIEDKDLPEAQKSIPIAKRITKVRKFRETSPRAGTRHLALRPHQLDSMNIGQKHSIIVPVISSEGRNYLPCGLLNKYETVSHAAFALHDAPLWNLALIASRIHWIWISNYCGKLKTDIRYSSTLGWNTFPVPTLTAQNKTDLTNCAERILLEREKHFPATIAELYSDNMPANLNHAHCLNDEVVERIYIGRLFRNDAERLEKLTGLYNKMIMNKMAMANERYAS